MLALESIGSDVEHFECPRCGSHDRERHLFLYLKASKLLEKMRGRSILHFAPERNLSKMLGNLSGQGYVSCDLFPKDDRVLRVNMEDIQFESEVFDFVIANHVLEHVGDLQKALSELFRVTAKGGYAILQTPFAKKLRSSWCDAGIDTPDARLHSYGQEDHVRLFGSDIFDIIQDSGFKSSVRQHDDLLDHVDSERLGVNPKEPFFLFKKP